MGQPKASPVTQTTQVKLGPEQQQLFQAALPSIQQYAASTPQLFPGSSIAGFSPMELLGQQYATSTAAPTAASLASSGAAAQQQMLDPNFMLGPNQYVSDAANALTHQVTDNLMQHILPGIRATSTSTAGPSAITSREGIAQGLAIGQTNRGLSDAIANMLLANYTHGLDKMSTAIGQNPSVLQSQLFPASIYSAVGAQGRGLEQAKLDEQVRQFYAQQDLPLSRAQQLIGLMSGMPGGQGVTSVQPSMPKTNPLMQGIGLGMQALGLATGMPFLDTVTNAAMGMGK